MSARPGVYVLSGPGGVGKGTVVAALKRRHPEVLVAVSATTRRPRPREVDGVHYHFLSDEQFDELVAQGGFLEWAEFAGCRYGTPWTAVHAAGDAGRPLVLEIDIQGARQVRERLPEAVLIFLAPPDRETLLERLFARGTDGPERVAERMAIAEWELAQSGDFDHVVVNDDLAGAVAAIARILRL